MKFHVFYDYVLELLLETYAHTTEKKEIMREMVDCKNDLQRKQGEIHSYLHQSRAIIENTRKSKVTDGRTDGRTDAKKRGGKKEIEEEKSSRMLESIGHRSLPGRCLKRMSKGKAGSE